MGALANYNAMHFGVETRYNDTAMNTVVAATPTPLWRNNPDRLELVFTNLGANIVYLNVHESVAADNGFYLAANGGSITLTAEEDGELVGFPWYGIAAGNTDIHSAEVEGV